MNSLLTVFGESGRFERGVRGRPRPGSNQAKVIIVLIGHAGFWPLHV